MKKITSFFVATLLFATSAFAGNISFYGVTDKNPLEYQPSEPMVFTIQCLEDGKPVDGQNLSWKRTGDDGKVEEGVAVSSSTEPLIITTSLDVPGFVRIQVFPIDANGNMIGSEHQEEIQFNGGAGVLLDQVVGIPEPEDFDAFWDRQKAILAQVPIRANLIPVPSNDENMLNYDVKIDCSGLTPVSGYLSIPKDAKEKSLPAYVFYVGYGIGGTPLIADRNRITLSINAHGILNGQSQEYYKALGQTFLKDYGFSVEENKYPESCYWCGMMMRGLRALQYVKTLPEWDGVNLTTAGGSQGGLQCITIAGLDPDVTQVDAVVPWFCDVSGFEKSSRLDSWFMPTWVDGLGYFDTTNHAKRVKGKVNISVGLGDYVCPPSGEMVLYNAIKSEKRIQFHQGRTHGYTEINAPEYILESAAQE